LNIRNSRWDRLGAGPALGGWGPPPNLEIGGPNIQYTAFNTEYLCKQNIDFFNKCL